MNKRRSGNGGNQTNNHKQTPQQTSNYPSTNQSHPTQARSLWSVMRSIFKILSSYYYILIIISYYYYDDYCDYYSIVTVLIMIL